MFVLSNLVRSVADLIHWTLDVYFWVVVLRVVFSWVNADPSNGLVRAVTALTEPALRPFRRLLPPYRMGGWDLSPLLLCLAIKFIQSFLGPTLHQWASRMG